jgi:hypothetical protein
MARLCGPFVHRKDRPWPCPFGFFSIEVSKFPSGRTNPFVNQLGFLS